MISWNVRAPIGFDRDGPCSHAYVEAFAAVARLFGDG